MISFNIDSDIKKSETLPSEFYLENQYFKFCKEFLFPSSWQLITDVQNLDKNNIYPFCFLEDFIDEPLVLVKGDSSIKCLSNVCTHRAHLIATEKCNNNKLRCMYHGRTFNLDGTFNSMPGFKDVENFPTKRDNLESIPIYNWKNFIMVSLEKKIEITGVFKDIESRLPNFPFDKLSYDEKNSYTGEIDAHWAMYCENYLEGFHVPFVHKGLANEIDVSTYKTVLLENAVLQIAEDDKGRIETLENYITEIHDMEIKRRQDVNALIASLHRLNMITSAWCIITTWWELHKEFPNNCITDLDFGKVASRYPDKMGSGHFDRTGHRIISNRIEKWYNENMDTFKR